MEIDHINNDKKDNRLCNLRLATRSGNDRNRTIPTDNKSGYKGVSYIKRIGMWRSQIGYNNEVIYLGVYRSKRKAYEAYKKKANQLFGEFANFC